MPITVQDLNQLRQQIRVWEQVYNTNRSVQTIGVREELDRAINTFNSSLQAYLAQAHVHRNKITNRRKTASYNCIDKRLTFQGELEAKIKSIIN